MQIENFSARDRFLFNTVLSLRCDTTPEQLSDLLNTMWRKLKTSDTVAPGARINLIEMTRSAIDVEVFCHLVQTYYVAFLNDREALLSFLFETVTANGSVLAFPPSLVETTSDTRSSRVCRSA
ncbi:MAG: hypothetical protein AAGA06_12825 [Pseudomonadota bacterium]